MRKYNTPDIEDMRSMVNEHNEIVNKKNDHNDNVYINKIFNDIASYAENGLTRYSVTMEKIEGFVKEYNLEENRNDVSIFKSLENKINTYTDYISFNHANKLVISWDLIYKEKVELTEEPKLNIFRKFYNIMFLRN